MDLTSHQPVDTEDDHIAKEVVDAAYCVHRELGPGLLESVYETCLARELALRGISSERQIACPIVYRGAPINDALRLDMLVAGRIVVELKAVDKLLPVHEAQLLTYLKLTGKRLGFLINFNVPVLKQGIRRRVV